MRARELGIIIGRVTPGPHNTITGVAGVRVGHVTLVEGDGPLFYGVGKAGNIVREEPTEVTT